MSTFLPAIHPVQQEHCCEGKPACQKGVARRMSVWGRCARLGCAFALALILSSLVGKVSGQSQGAIEVSEVQVQYLFGSYVTFSARLRTATPVQEAWLLFQSIGDPNIHLGHLNVTPDGRAVYQHSLANGALRPFAPVQFWYRLRLSSGEMVTSQVYTFQYIDNRVPWQILEDEWVRVHWYAGDLDFGQAAFDIAHVGIQKVSEVLPYQKGPPVDLYIYASSADLQNALNLGSTGWVSGHAAPELGVALVAVAPDPAARSELGRQIPHELAHLILYQRAGPAYERLPVWLREGIASLAELHPNPDYQTALRTAAQNSALLDMNSLCEAFPADAARAYLAYAQADSFTRYLYTTYGAPSLFNLILAYADGLDCEQGPRRALGMSLSQLDRRWRQSALQTNAIQAAGSNLLPYLILLFILLSLPLWGWSPVMVRRKYEQG